MNYYREQKDNFLKALETGKIIVLTGPRQVGKSTLVKSILDEKKIWEFNFDLEEERKIFSESSKLKIETLISSLRSSGKDCIFIDEVQKNLKAFELIKYIHDHFKDIKIVISGSTALEIEEQSFETLTGRAIYLKLLGLTAKEIYHQSKKLLEEDKKYKDSLIISGAKEVLSNATQYGTYPAVYYGTNKDVELEALANNIALKDLKISDANYPKLKHLLKLLALQIGSPVSPQSLAENTELSKPTIYEYLDRLERLFIIHRLYPVDVKDYQSISRGFKVYFWDLGLRNYFVNDFTEIDKNHDNGHLFENLVVSQLKKEMIYHKKDLEMGYFRNVNHSEVDIVLNEELYECKYGEKRDKIFSKLFNKEINCINKTNWIKFLA